MTDRPTKKHHGRIEEVQEGEQGVVTLQVDGEKYHRATDRAFEQFEKASQGDVVDIEFWINDNDVRLATDLEFVDELADKSIPSTEDDHTSTNQDNPKDVIPAKLIMVDVDGTLTKGETPYWEEGDMCKPDYDMIEWVNEAYTNGAHIVIQTARPWMHAQETAAWLDKHGVRYHGLRMNKGGADLYVDDKTIRPEERLRAFFNEDGDIRVQGGMNDA